MKTVGILTFHFVHNYGALLQAWALQTFIDREGCDATFINFRPEDHVQRYRFAFDIHRILKRRDMNEFIKKFRRSILSGMFDRFIKKNIKQTNTVYISAAQLLNNPPAFDCYIAGSDQIWNESITGTINSYLLDFVKSGRKIAWAASMADTHSSDQQSRFKAWLPKFDVITLREKQHADFIADVSGKEISVVLDPVFLLSRDDWYSFALKAKSKLAKGKYIFVYCLGNPEHLESKAHAFSAKSGLPLISVHPFNISFPGAHKSLVIAGPHEFVHLIHNAACVVTDSFHATSFSILFGTPLLLAPPVNNSGRLFTLLETLGLKYTEDLIQMNDQAILLLSEKVRETRTKLVRVLSEENFND